MAKDFAKKFYNSKQWLRVREAFRIVKFGMCERCGLSDSKHIHHKILLTELNINDPDITLGFNNLELLCHECHNKEHMSKWQAVGEGVAFNINSEIVSRNG